MIYVFTLSSSFLSQAGLHNPEAIMAAPSSNHNAEAVMAAVSTFTIADHQELLRMIMDWLDTRDDTVDTNANVLAMTMHIRSRGVVTRALLEELPLPEGDETVAELLRDEALNLAHARLGVTLARIREALVDLDALLEQGMVNDPMAADLQNGRIHLQSGHDILEVSDATQHNAAATAQFHIQCAQSMCPSNHNATIKIANIYSRNMVVLRCLGRLNHPGDREAFRMLMRDAYGDHHYDDYQLFLAYHKMLGREARDRPPPLPPVPAQPGDPDFATDLRRDYSFTSNNDAVMTRTGRGPRLRRGPRTAPMMPGLMPVPPGPPGLTPMNRPMMPEPELPELHELPPMMPMMPGFMTPPGPWLHPPWAWPYPPSYELP